MKTNVKPNDTKGVSRRVGRGISRLGSAVLLCLGLMAMLAMAVVVVVLAPVVLLATAVPLAKENRPRESGRQGKGTWHRRPYRQGNLVEGRR